IAHGVNIVYKVIAVQGGKGTAATALRRIIKRQDRPTIREVHAVKDVSINAYKADAIDVIGQNGSGESTITSAVSGLPNSGSGPSERSTNCAIRPALCSWSATAWTSYWTPATARSGSTRASSASTAPRTRSWLPTPSQPRTNQTTSP